MGRPALHFVAFKGDEYWSAVKVWGRPGFIHRRLDLRARRDLADEDTVIFAQGTEADPPAVKSGDDLREEYL
jgi:hypothetical protein